MSAEAEIKNFKGFHPVSKLASLVMRPTLTWVSRLKVFEECKKEKRVESHFNHRTNVQKWKGFSAAASRPFLDEVDCCKKGACNFSTSHFVNHLRWFENMQRRLTGIRHMKSNYLHAIFLSSWDEEKHKLQTCSKKSVLKLLQNPKISTS